ncbi:hypothetical protein FPV67DRAFT_1557780 [Lyophyllum atratum]|nr:hypothetical protein FPV67DRAFT_1557780 [Lyophyllum atratum]
MVGRFITLSSKQPPAREPRVSDLGRPPPPYDPNSNPPIIVAETTTTRTEVVTTTTTTHFFSLPLWRKRAFVPSTSSRQGSFDVQSTADEHGSFPQSARSSVLMIEKDLPPTPPEEEISNDTQRPGPSISQDHVLDNALPASGMSRSSIHPGGANTIPSASESFTAMRSTAALAHASLGLGLRHVLPNASPSSSSLEVNTVAFTTLQPQAVTSPPKKIRRSKSAQKLKAILSLDSASTDVAPEEEEYIRTRGVSLTGAPLLHLGKADAKGKGKAQADRSYRPTTSPQATGRSLARRASFWSRKKLVPPENSEHLSPHPPTTPQLSQLPLLQPISPFNMNMNVTPSSPSPAPKTRSSHSRGHSAFPLPLESTSTESVGKNSYVDPKETNAPTRRPRAQTNPPLLNRLSLTWLPTSSTAPPPLPRVLNPSSAPTRPHTSSGTFPSLLFKESPSSSHSSRPSFERGSVTAIPLPSGTQESPEVYLKRLQAAVSKAEIAGILASSSTTFYAQALRTYIGQFNFVDDPLDVALRKLLMEVGLPRETQQIDRVIEAFAGRYMQCNPALFTSDDHPYILAFSLIMLHTDAFNKSNKRKMSKADYIKNTRLPGVAPEVLDCFYDNIVFAPFIFIEDPLDINGQRGLSAEASNQATSGDLLGPLRVDVEAFVPNNNPYSYEGTLGPWDEAQLQLAFAKASQIEVGAVPDTAWTPGFFSLGAGTGLASPLGNIATHTPIAASPSSRNLWTLKLTKVGLLNRKDDILEGGKKASNRKWRQWSVVLTGSQLLFFRDPSWASSLVAHSDGHAILPQLALFKPDELLSVKGAIAVYDKSYTKYENTFRFALADGRRILLQAPNDKELNEWMAGVNYASAFKSAGVRMRPLEMSGTDVKLTGVAAATSHLHDLQIHSAKSHIWDGDAPRDLMGMLSGDSELDAQLSPSKRKLTIVTDKDDMDLEVPIAPEIDGAEQFKATFDQVKADLAAVNDHLPSSATSAPSESSRLPSRAQIIQSKIEDIDSRIIAVQSQLDANMRFVRNIGNLTPFQKSTRDRLTAAVQNVAQRVVQVRLEITKLSCHRNVLANDLASEGRSWHRAKVIALRAATETLQSRHPITREPSFTSYHLDPSPTHRPESSICESFHSAMEFGPDWLPFEGASSSFLGTGHLSDSPSPSRSPSLNSHSLRDGRAESPRQSSILSSNFQRQAESPRTSSDVLSHEKFYTALENPEEEAEEWDQTRCAQRVSLVRVPSDVQLKPRVGRQQVATNVRSNLEG